MLQYKKILVQRLADIRQLRGMLELDPIAKENYEHIRRILAREQARASAEVHILVSLEKGIKLEAPAYGGSGVALENVQELVRLAYESYQGKKFQYQFEGIYSQVWLVLSRFLAENGCQDKIDKIQANIDKYNIELKGNQMLNLISQWSKSRVYSCIKALLKPTRSHRGSVISMQRYATELKNSEETQIEHQIVSRKKIRTLTEQQTSGALLSDKQLQSRKKKSETIVNPKGLVLHNRSSVYNYLIQSLVDYYQLVDVVEVDKNYLKTFSKRRNSQLLLLPQNMKKAAEVLIENGANKFIKTQIAQYQENYWKNPKHKKSEIKKYRIQKQTQAPKISKKERIMSDFVSSVHQVKKQRMVTELSVFKHVQYKRKQAIISIATLSEEKNSNSTQPHSKIEMKFSILDKLCEKFRNSALSNLKLPVIGSKIEGRELHPNYRRSITEDSINQNLTRNPRTYKQASRIHTQREALHGFINNNFTAITKNKKTSAGGENYSQQRKIQYFNNRQASFFRNEFNQNQVDGKTIIAELPRSRQPYKFNQFNTIQH